MSRRRLAALVALICCAMPAAVAVRGQMGAQNGEWRAYGGDTGHTRYAPLDQINAANFSTQR
jgi:glucose dehydrogenase